MTSHQLGRNLELEMMVGFHQTSSTLASIVTRRSLANLGSRLKLSTKMRSIRVTNSAPALRRLKRTSMVNITGSNPDRSRTPYKMKVLKTCRGRTLRCKKTHRVKSTKTRSHAFPWARFTMKNHSMSLLRSTFISSIQAVWVLELAQITSLGQTDH